MLTYLIQDLRARAINSCLYIKHNKRYEHTKSYYHQSPVNIKFLSEIRHAKDFENRSINFDPSQTPTIQFTRLDIKTLTGMNPVRVKNHFNVVNLYFSDNTTCHYTKSRLLELLEEKYELFI